MVRPRKTQIDARSARFNLRLTEDERAELEQRARIVGKCAHDYARSAVLGYRLPAPLTPANRALSEAAIPLVLALNRLGVNLNQIARALNANAGINPVELIDTLTRINQVLDELQGID